MDELEITDALAISIKAKIVGSDFENSINGRFYDGGIQEKTDYPCSAMILPMAEDMLSERTFTEDVEEISIQFSVFSNTPYSKKEVRSTKKQLTKLFDECDLTILGWNLIYIRRTNANLMREIHDTKSGVPEVWHYAVDYSILLEKDTSDPATEDLLADTDSDVLEDTDSDVIGMRS
jgi:hypothetical protein